MKQLKLYIDGEYRDSGSSEAFDNINPANAKTISTVQEASADDVDDAVKSAKAAFETWSSTSPAKRGQILTEAAQLLRERNEELARLEVMDTGKPLSEAIDVDIHSAADCLEYFGGLASKIHGEHVDLGGDFFYTRREPIGICAGIGAWNYPIQVASWKAAPALAAGNTMIFKPAEQTPTTTLKMAEILTEAGLPKGVFNVIHGSEKVGQALTSHPDIDKVSLTGEVETGKKVMESAASTLKQVTLELGGKSPILVFDDAHVKDAVSGAILGNFFTQGEVCSNGTRVYLHESIKEEFIDQLVKRTKNMKIGDPLNLDTDVGALISREHYQKVTDYINIGKEEGASLVYGGDTAPLREVEELKEGFFVEPTVFADCTDEMRIVREEIFGPVMSILTFSGEEEAIERANNTPYGLSAGIFTSDISRAHRVAARIKAGTQWINTYNLTPVEMPFGAYKQSGFGRENGRAALDYYTQQKSIYVGMNGVDAPY